MTISLVRHGRPIADLSSRIRATAFPEWLRAYDEAGVDCSLPPPDALKKSLAGCAIVITSPARRATESAAALDLPAERKVLIDAREAPLPMRIVWPVSHRPATFTVMARILWIFGLGRAEETKQEVRCRADNLARQLCMLSHDLGHVVLVGHGYMNRFVRTHLEKAGWRASGSRSNTYWSCSHFEKEKNDQAPETTSTVVNRSAFESE
jgi:broad specificity phosphatase PhoE